MEKAPGFVLFPPAALRLHIAPEEWEACLEAWITLAEAYLRLPAPSFESLTGNDGSGVISFLASYVHEHSESTAPGSLLSTRHAVNLHRLVFLLCHRLLSSERIRPALLEWLFLSEFSQIFRHNSSLHQLLDGIWKKRPPVLEANLQSVKDALIKDLDSGKIEIRGPTIRKLIHLFHSCAPVAAFFAIGSDFIDCLINAYPKASTSAQQILTLIAYLALISLIQLPNPNYSLLSDHLYSLRTNAQSLKNRNQSSLLGSLVSNTPLIHKLQKMSTTASDSESTHERKSPRDLSAGLLEFRTTRSRPSHGRSKVGKGKALQSANEALDVVHIHRMTQISQVQDLFPELGSGFILKLLDEYDENVETVTAHLLDDSLPTHLATAERSEQLQSQEHAEFETPAEVAAHFPPRSTPPLSERHNVFDNDEFDNLAVHASKLHIGKANQQVTADSMLKSGASNKAAILAALSQFDLDDDERDDTYDDVDVGGTVDNSVDTDRDTAAWDTAERVAYQTWKSSPGTFDRDPVTRGSSARANLKRETGWSDEVIEGWAIMLQREPGRVRTLERRFGEWQGEQSVIKRSAWTETENEEGTDGEAPAPSHGYRGRGGRGGSSRGVSRGGNTAGASDDRSTQRARRGKEVRGNQAKKAGRARKMARGMA